MKFCFKCQKMKEEDKFYSKGSFCRDCQRQCATEYYRNNKEKILAQHHEKKKIISDYNRKRYLKNREKQIVRALEWNKNNIEQHRKSSKKYFLNHKEERRIYLRKYRSQNVIFRINSRIRGGIRRSLRQQKQGAHWETILDYNVKTLKKHLDKTMPPKYDWNDFLSGKLHIDHYIPLSVFNFKTIKDIDFKRAWAIKNLRLLPIKENLIKRSKIPEPFQPSLGF